MTIRLNKIGPYSHLLPRRNKFQCKLMLYFGDNCVTLGRNIDFNEYWCSSSVIGNSQIDCRLWYISRAAKALKIVM